MDKEYKKINPETYMINGMFDSSSLVGVPIKLGRDKEIMELFDDITKQLINMRMIMVLNLRTQYCHIKSPYVFLTHSRSF